MSESMQSSRNLNLWAVLAVALLLSITAIVLQLSKVMDRYGDHQPRAMYDNQLLLNQISSVRSELAKLQSDIANAPNFSKLKQQLQLGQIVTATETPRGSRLLADSPLAAMMILEQSLQQRNFEQYLAILPDTEKKQLERLQQVNRELGQVYAEITNLVQRKFSPGNLPDQLTEDDNDRLYRLLFNERYQFECTDTKRPKSGEAVLTVKLTSMSSIDDPKTIQVKMSTLRGAEEAGFWKISDRQEAHQQQKQYIESFSKLIVELKKLQTKLADGKIATMEAFETALAATLKEKQ
ncbi:MAG: hypothetical protein JNJ77_17190 [Planctomycetia bacterium]|nr:hypothetical protein [Planctomycetia bacterium]